MLGCGYVDDVIIDAPWVIEDEMIASLHISAVVVSWVLVVPGSATLCLDVLLESQFLSSWVRVGCTLRDVLAGESESLASG